MTPLGKSISLLRSVKADVLSNGVLSSTLKEEIDLFLQKYNDEEVLDELFNTLKLARSLWLKQRSTDLQQEHGPINLDNITGMWVDSLLKGGSYKAIFAREEIPLKQELISAIFSCRMRIKEKNSTIESVLRANTPPCLTTPSS